MIVKRIGNRDVMLMSYWDGGYVTLDVTDPASPKALSDTDFAAADPARAERGQTITPEGNGHQAEFTRDNKFFFATDEDFDPYRVQATFKGGPANGKTFTAIQAPDAVADQPGQPAGRRHAVHRPRRATPLPAAAAPARSRWPSAAPATSR